MRTINRFHVYDKAGRLRAVFNHPRGADLWIERHGLYGFCVERYQTIQERDPNESYVDRDGLYTAIRNLNA
jgi:hypothetical protein